MKGKLIAILLWLIALGSMATAMAAVSVAMESSGAILGTAVAFLAIVCALGAMFLGSIGALAWRSRL
jgi:hypothetical protein